jgi:hypothetical protein
MNGVTSNAQNLPKIFGREYFIFVILNLGITKLDKEKNQRITGEKMGHRT